MGDIVCLLFICRTIIKYTICVACEQVLVLVPSLSDRHSFTHSFIIHSLTYSFIHSFIHCLLSVCLCRSLCSLVVRTPLSACGAYSRPRHALTSYELTRAPSLDSASTPRETICSAVVMMQ